MGIAVERLLCSGSSNNKPHFLARFYPLRLRNIGKTATRHKRVVLMLRVRYRHATQHHRKDEEEYQNK